MKKLTSYKWCQDYDEYWEGLDAAAEGMLPDSNPYQKDSKEWICWRAGWLGVC